MPSSIDWRDLWFDEDAGFDDETIAWLESRGPDIWHQCALDLNWDWGWRIQGWICSQPQTSVSTAAAMFWLSQPQELIDPSMNRELISDPGSCYYLAKLIAENMQEGFDSTEHFPVLWNSDSDELVSSYRSVLAAHPDLASPWSAVLDHLPQMKVHSPQQLLAIEEFVEGIPREIYGDGV